MCLEFIFWVLLAGGKDRLGGYVGKANVIVLDGSNISNIGL